MDQVRPRSDLGMYELELEHSRLLSYSLAVDELLISESRCSGYAKMLLPSGAAKILLNPINQDWGFVPRIRIDGFLVNTFLAGIKLWDHMIEFNIDGNFFLSYNANVRTSIINSVPEQHRTNWEYISKYCGMSLGYDDLVGEIRHILDAQHHIHHDS